MLNVSYVEALAMRVVCQFPPSFLSEALLFKRLVCAEAIQISLDANHRERTGRN